ncbi:DNA cytosine methyltransferase [Helicobacter pylori]|uniref:DNA cytosine methyltransferase n=1 Tax=Helicobacter pylori TaxID=210 RepID=UPI00123833E2|nr:DNA (cytosine-5-)-methyltransferase [Helicobacter pylori]KAA6502059.1 DNA (cytosine-5-)-methyltransferase [Helicobacter pylori]KAA6503090.1 DNA (cytosine-5-)-methyltransferase [Helicobacter pylori]KAA6518279.1 DNA (cytosine-5-)-methyltransferase [Helicobacter pylori]MBH0268898.1 DNA (cytosine-5-)-methyltransferase [Helicobacter pylori]MBH0277945.1 DNA (cytosine-5-)-methyltransferase [Helicobacter pylori]
MKIASLFSGIGGIDLGFIQNGFEIVWANDFDKHAVETYKANIGQNIILGDIEIEKDHICGHDILIGGFPCQPFSTLGSLQGFEDKRGTLFFTICEIIKKHRPKIVVLENVKNLINHNKGESFKRILFELNELDYQVNYDILNTLDFGIPQQRNRVFIVALRKNSFTNLEFVFPAKIPCKISALDLLDKQVELKYFISQKMIKTILGKGTKGYIVEPSIDTPIAKTLTATMHKCHRASQDNYYTDLKNWERYKDNNYSIIRRLTPNEARKLQGFPSNFKQVVSDTQSYKQFGNAVSVNVSFALAKAIKKHCELFLKKG